VFIVYSDMFRLTWVIFRLELYLFATSLCSFWDLYILSSCEDPWLFFETKRVCKQKCLGNIGVGGRLHYTARCLISKLHIQVTQSLRRLAIPCYIFLFFNAQPTNQPTITGVALCYKKVGRPWSRLPVYSKYTVHKSVLYWIICPKQMR